MKLFSRILTAGALSAAITLGASASAPQSAYAQGAGDVQEVEVLVKGNYTPDRIEVTEGQRLRLKFTRKESSPCTRDVVFPALGIKKELPENQLVVIELPALRAGEYEFKCGMNMIKGTVVVKPKA